MTTAIIFIAAVTIAYVHEVIVEWRSDLGQHVLFCTRTQCNRCNRR